MRYTKDQLACLRAALAVRGKMTLAEVRNELNIYGVPARPGFNLANDLIISGCIMENNGRVLVTVPKKEEA